MLPQHNRPAPWSPWRAATDRRGKRLSTGVIILFFLFALPHPPAHAIGPYLSGDKTVIDQGTGLEWQKTDNGTMHTWQNAVDYCEALSLSDKSDWRVPNIRELKSLVEYNRAHPAVDPAIPCKSSSYWSSTTVADAAPTSIWVVFFANGDDIWKVTTENAYIRCVRTEFPEQ